MSISFSRCVRTAGLIGAFLVAPCLSMNPGTVSAAEMVKGCRDDGT